MKKNLLSILLLLTVALTKGQNCSIVASVYCPMGNNTQKILDAMTRFEITGSTGSTPGPCSVVSTVDCPLGNNTEILLDSLLRVMIAGGGGGGGGISSITFAAPLTGGTITTSGTAGITRSSTTVDGYLSHLDFTTFNNKQNAITLTTTGTSGVATFSGGTLNIPDYTASTPTLAQVLTAGNDGGGLDIVNVTNLIDASAFTAVNINGESLLSNLGGNFNWRTMQFTDHSNVNALNPAFRACTNTSGAVVIDWGNSWLKAGTTIRYNWNTQVFNDASSGTQVFNLSSGNTLNLNNTKITGLANGTNPQDAVNFSQLPTFANGGADTSITVYLSSSNIATLNSIPVTINLPSLGTSGAYYQVIAGSLNYSYNTEPFSNTTIYVGNTTLAPSTTGFQMAVQGQINQPASSFLSLQQTVFNITPSTTNIVINDSLSIWAETDDGAGGDGSAVLKLQVIKVK